MEKIKIAGRIVGLFGNSKGNYNEKFNRSTKLARQFDKLLKKMDGFIEQTETVTTRVQCALAVKLLMTTGIRVGNESSAEGYKSKRKGVGMIKTFGLTTLQSEHIKFRSGNAYLSFTGKRGIEQSIKISDPRLVSQIKRVLDYNSESGSFLSISGVALRNFVKRSVGSKFTPKDFRTLRANIDGWLFYKELSKRPLPELKRDANAEIKKLTEHVSEILGNTPSICKRSYIDEFLLEFIMEQRWYNS